MRGQKKGQDSMKGFKTHQQIPFRLHVNDHKRLKSKLALEPKRISIQTLVEACVLAYLDGDEHVRAIIREHKMLSTVNKKTQSWSQREQDNLLSEIERASEEDE
jgi:hypothetical protein